MSDVSRRDLLRNIALSATLGGLTADAAQHVHQIAREEKAATGDYKPKLFTAHEFQTVQRLADLIIPADDVSKGALDAGAPEFIDLMASGNDRIAAIYTGGIAWLDRAMEKRHGAKFIDARPEQQTAMLDLIAWRKNLSPELAPGIHFFEWARKMVADAFYTSKAGIEDLGFKGNVGMSQFQVPVEALEHALQRSGLK